MEAVYRRFYFLIMIQRKQVIFMFLCAVIMVILPFISIWVKDLEGMDKYIFKPMQFSIVSKEGVKDFFYPYATMGALSFINTLLSFCNIFLYKNRMLQIKICNALNFSIFGLVILIGFLSRRAFTIAGNITFSDIKIGIFLPIIALIVNALAMHFVKKDEALVRSSDRLR